MDSHLTNGNAKMEFTKNGTNTFYHKDVEITPIGQRQPIPPVAEQLKFGHHFTDHMVEVDWSEREGWTRPRICPLHHIKLHPAAKVLHYSIEIFEGMKAFRGPDGRIRLFRPDMNMARMRRAARRASLPDFDPEELLKLICELVRLDGDWVPHSKVASLYIRPTMIATDATLDLNHPVEAKLYVIAGPVGAYFPSGLKPVSVLADPNYARAFPGGVGAFKMGCNYSPTVHTGKLAIENGCHQVLWLSGEDEKLTEVGVMNIFVLWRDEKGALELVTPPIDEGLVLPGIVRDSLLKIARDWNEFRVSERYPTMEELRKAVVEGRVLQMFGTGTACAVCPVDKVLYLGGKRGDSVEQLLIPTISSSADVMQRFYDLLTGIQFGREGEKHEWIHYVD